MLGRMFGHEFHALVISQKFLIADDFAALFGFGPPSSSDIPFFCFLLLPLSSNSSATTSSCSQTGSVKM